MKRTAGTFHLGLRIKPEILGVDGKEGKVSWTVMGS